MRGNLGGGNNVNGQPAPRKTGAGEGRNLPQWTELYLKCVATRDVAVAPQTETAHGYGHRKQPLGYHQKTSIVFFL